MNFSGFPVEGLRFLNALTENNDAAWFKPRREEYEATVRGPMVALVADLLMLAAAQKILLSGDPEKAVFRIHRDVRFSKAKRPYTTHCGASVSRTGVRLAPDEEAAKRLPRGCELGLGTPVEAFLKYRNFTARHALGDEAICSAGLPTLLLERFKAARPLLDFGWEVVDGCMYRDDTPKVVLKHVRGD